jgi:hypothetical protein
MAVELFAKVIAYGFPALCLMLGFSAWTGGAFAEAIFGTSGGMATIGLFLMAIGVMIYIIELLFFR